MKLGAQTLGLYMSKIIISFWCISPFISMKCPSLAHLTNASLKSAFSGINIATPACFGGPLAWESFFQSFTLNQCLFLWIRCVSCKEQIVQSSFLVQFLKECLLIGELSPLTFSINTDRYVIFSAIYLLLLLKDLVMCIGINAILWLLVFYSPVVWYLPSSHGFVSFHLQSVAFLVKSSIVVAWWSCIGLVSVYHGRFLLSFNFEW
jgi:hypothetical protein